MIERGRAVRGAAAVALVAALAVGLPMASAWGGADPGATGGIETPAPEPPALFDVRVEASPIFTEARRDAFLLNPLAEANFAYTQVRLTDLGQRTAVAAVFTPGPAESAGGLLPALIVPDLVPGQPTLPPLPSLPPFPNRQIAEYPSRPDGSFGGGDLPQNPFLEGTAGNSAAHAREWAAQADAEMADLRGTVLVKAVKSSVEGHVENDGTLLANATSVLKDISIGGIVRIGSLTSLTTVVGRPAVLRSTSRLVLSDVTVLGGIPATIDENGVRVLGATIVPGSPLRDLNKQLAEALKDAHLNVALIAATGSEEAPGQGRPATSGSGGLVINAVGEVPTTLPAGGGKNYLQWILGHSTGFVKAAGFAEETSDLNFGGGALTSESDMAARPEARNTTTASGAPGGIAPGLSPSVARVGVAGQAKAVPQQLSFDAPLGVAAGSDEDGGGSHALSANTELAAELSDVVPNRRDDGGVRNPNPTPQLAIARRVAQVAGSGGLHQAALWPLVFGACLVGVAVLRRFAVHR